ncbi:MAG: pentapeptide repeat-containing protein [Hyphomonadaceae bacterium]|nr:pentapeptide repeat-containing protein [Hyphomonadaceae bacterium]
MKKIGALSSFSRLLGRFVIVLAVALAGASAHAAGDPKLALVVANWAYSPAHGEQWPLSRPGADAIAISEALTAAGFTVRPVVRNADKARLEAAIAAFAADVRAAGPRATAVFYYAGHGGADVAGGGNYIVPVDASPESVTRIDRTGVSVDFVTRTIAAAGARATLVIFDACRNPLLQPGETPVAPAPIAGWVRERERVGAIVSFAQIQDEAAMDDGVFAMSLASAIKTRGLTIEQALDKVQSEVAVRSRGRQAPSYLDGIVETICLYDCTPPQAALQNTDQALSVLRSAQTQRPRGDQGQAAALQALMAQGRTFEGGDFGAISFARADLGGLLATQADFSLADLSGANLTGAILSRGDFKTASLSEARLERASAEQASFLIVVGDGLVASDAQLRQSSWIAASLRGAVFRDAELSGASFLFADLRNADFTNSNLTDVNFAGADLRGARFVGATLRNNDITGAVADESQRAAFIVSGACGRSVGAGVSFSFRQVVSEDRALPVASLRMNTAGIRPSLGLTGCARPKVTQTFFNGERRISFYYDDEERLSVGGDYSHLYYKRAHLNAAGRQSDVIELVAARDRDLEARQAAFEQLPHLQRFRQSMIDEMRRRARETRPSKQLNLHEHGRADDEEAALLAALAAAPGALPADWKGWSRRARDRLNAERKPTAGAPWPRLYPDAFTGTDYGIDDFDVVGAQVYPIYRTWTIERARSVTPELLLEMRMAGTRPAPASLKWRDLSYDGDISHDQNGFEYRSFGNYRLIFRRPPDAALLSHWTPWARWEIRLRVVRAEYLNEEHSADLLIFVEPLSVSAKAQETR